MEIKILDRSKIDCEIANEIIRIINHLDKVNLGLATGSSPLGVYNLLVEAYKKGKVSFKNVTSFNLDEYCNLDNNNEQSYHYFMNLNLFNNIDIDKKHTFFPNEFKDYDEFIEKMGGIDFQILGIGSDGHIAFNEPGTSFNSLTHIADLAPSTIKDNSRFFKSIEEVPTKSFTMGLASIIRAKRIVLIATGKNKAEAIRKLIDDEPNESLPASILKNHKNVTIYVDNDAFSLVK